VLCEFDAMVLRRPTIAVGDKQQTRPTVVVVGGARLHEKAIASHNLSHDSMRDGTATSPSPNAKRFTQ
jgi:hypothetical protein